jgi:hypothetical protein
MSLGENVRHVTANVSQLFDEKRDVCVNVQAEYGWISACTSAYLYGIAVLRWSNTDEYTVLFYDKEATLRERLAEHPQWSIAWQIKPHKDEPKEPRP